MKAKIDERKKGVSSRYELKIKTKRGGVIWVNASGAPVYDANGNVVGSIGINTDITQRKKVEAELESLSRFPSENPMPVLRYSIDQQDFIYSNKSGKSIVRRLNLNKNLTLKRHWKKLFLEAYQKNRTIHEELQDASVLYTCNIVPVQKSSYVNIYMSDITEERMAEEALMESEAKFRSLVENMNEGVVRININDTIEYVNNSFCQILGYSQKELLGNNRFDVLTVDEDSMKAIEISVARRKKGISSKYELKHQRKSGEWIWVSINGTPLYDDKGVMVGSMGIVADITNQKRFEEEIRALNAGLEDRVEERTVELEKANQEIRALLQEMHHRVKNNLQIVSSLLNLQAASVDDEYVTQVFQECQNRLQTMSFIHESLYLNESMSEISVKDYLEPIIRDRVRLNADLLNRVAVDVRFPDITFNIDTMLPVGLLLNELVTNSLKHAFPGDQGGEIIVELKILADKSAILYYSDTGVGFPIDIAGDKSGSIGLILIDSFTMQLDGELKHLDKPGTHYELKFNPL
jgi:PAS domain S-box-containing protein